MLKKPQQKPQQKPSVENPQEELTIGRMEWVCSLKAGLRSATIKIAP